MLKMSRFTRFSLGKIWFDDIGPCKRFYILQPCGNIIKGAGASEAPSQTKEEFSANDTSRHPKVFKLRPYSCFWSLGAIWQPLWLKNSHNVAIFSHFLTFSVTFLGAMTTFMHKTSTERTKTFLIHRTIDEVPFLPFPGTYPGVKGSKK